MEEQTFNKLAELLRPILSHNDYYASECCTVRIESRGCTTVVLLYGVLGYLLVHRLSLSAYCS